jgi:hypothetical protein
MNPELETIKQKALAINDQLNTMATAQGKATQHFDASGNRTMQQPVSANNVPMSSLATQSQSLSMPIPTVPQVDTKGAYGAAGSVLESFEAQKTAERDARANELSASDKRIREAVGILGTQEEARAGLEQKAGVDVFSQDLMKFQQQLRQQMADLDQFDVNNVNTIEAMRVDASKRDITKRTFNAMSAEANIQMAVERANMVGQTRATIAAIDVTQGNLQAATEQVDKALKAMYEPIKMGLEMEMFFNERNYSMFSDAQKELSNVRMMGVQRELDDIDRAISLVDAAVASGGATAEDIQKLTDPNASPTQQANIAMSIIGRKAREEYNLEKSIKGRQYEKLGIEIDSIHQKALAAQKATEAGVLTPEQFTTAVDLRKEVNNLAEVKAAKDLEPNVASLIAALEQGTGVGDISAINSFQRIAVDPGVAVREGDVALLQSAQSFTDQAVLKAKGLWVGDKLTPEARQQMLAVAKDVYRFRVTSVDENTQPIRTMAQEQGIDYGKYIGKNFASFEELQNRVTPQQQVVWGMENTDTYLDNILKSLSASPAANPFGVSF